MKNLYVLLALALLGSSSLKAQTSVDILYTDDTLTGPASYCSGSFVPIQFYLYAETVGYTSSDDPTITVDFGDGTSTTFVATNFDSYFPMCYVSALHAYSTSGVYDVTYIITMPDLMSDTLVVYNDVIIEPCDIISGNVYNDQNTNCILDGPDSPLSLYVVATGPVSGNYINYALADAAGYYELTVPSGVPIELSLSPWLGGSLNYICPASGIINTTAPSSGNDFAINCASYDLQPDEWTGFFHPGFSEYIKMDVLNYSCNIGVDVQLRVVVSNQLVTFVSGSAVGGDITPAVSGDTLTWDIPAAYLTNYIAYYGYTPPLVMIFTTDISAPIGSTICFDVIAEPIAGDLDPTNNIQTLCYPVLNAYDPNYIEVHPAGTTSSGLIDANEDMIYTVHFQNTGNFPATNIIIKDTLDGNVLDLGSFEFVSSTHAVTNIIASGDGAMAFAFDNINLPDSTSDEQGSHGSITYRIKQQPDLAPATTIENTAYIYFDFNAPIVTNTTLNTIKNSSTISEESITENQLTLFPVPSSGILTVFTNSNQISTYQIVDMNGAVQATGTVTHGEQISAENLSNGVYFFRLENGAVEKLIVNK